MHLQLVILITPSTNDYSVAYHHLNTLYHPKYFYYYQNVALDHFAQSPKRLLGFEPPPTKRFTNASMYSIIALEC